MNAALDRLIQLAKAEHGTREFGGNNRGARIVEYQGATWLAPGDWPWCAAFTCWLMREWLEIDEVRAVLADTFNKPRFTFSQADKLRCRDASAFGWEKWAQRNKLQLLPESARARAGDFVVFDFSHIGLVLEDQAHPAEPLKTIEGNTNQKGERDSDSGDGVWFKERAPHLVRSYLRISPVN